MIEKLKETFFSSILKKFDKPVIIVGSGINISNSKKSLLKFVKKYEMPVVTAWAHDAFPNYSKHYYGRQGSIGNRVGNFIVQNSNLIIILGSRLSIRQTSYNWKSFGKNAFKIWVDIDKFELNKKTVKADLKIHCSLNKFFNQVNDFKSNYKISKKWIKWCNKIKLKFTPKKSDYKKDSKYINVYHFTIDLFKQMLGNEIIICADGAATVVPSQVGYLKGNCRLIYNSGSASMGYELPAIVGASTSKSNIKRKIICLAGDGSIMMNIQELQTISNLKRNIIIFIINNDGYLSIKQTQKTFFDNEFGASSQSNLLFPNFRKIAYGFGIEYVKLNNNYEKQLSLLLKRKKNKPIIAEIKVSLDQEFEPRLKSKFIKGKIYTPELDDMFPFLSKYEYEKIKAEINN
jgi:acetolactate synthase-1/2/3 large subunit